MEKGKNSLTPPTNKQFLDGMDTVKTIVFTAHPTLKKCLTAYLEQARAEIAAEHPWTYVRAAAVMAYKLNMPEMDTLEGVRQYVNAVANGVCLGIFNGKEASSLLYAAQVAMSSLNRKAAA